MNPIKLTEDQESKIIEMSYGLFPELEMRWGESDSYYGGPGDYDMLWFKTDSDLDLIHWFEFCMTHLAKKLNLDFNNRPMIFSILIQNYHEHLIDYLYEEFKKLK